MSKETKVPDLIDLVRGRSPWNPSPGSELMDVYHQYDQPLLGVLKQNSFLYLFECIAGEVGPWSVWLFSQLQEQEVAALDEAEGDEFDQLVATIRAGRPGKLALSMEQAGIIVEADVIDMRTALQDGFATLVARFNHHVDDLRRTGDEIEHADWAKLVAS